MGFLFTRCRHSPSLWINQQGLTVFFQVRQVCLGGLVMVGPDFSAYVLHPGTKGVFFIKRTSQGVKQVLKQLYTVIWNMQ